MFNATIHSACAMQPLHCVWVLDTNRRLACVWLPAVAPSVQAQPRLHAYTHLCSIGQCA